MRPLAQDIEHPNPPRTKRGRPSVYDEDKVKQACALAYMGATDEEMAEFFGVTPESIRLWQFRHPEFREACLSFGEEADGRVERSLYKKAVEGDYKAQALWLSARRRKTYGGVKLNNDNEPLLPGSEPEMTTDRALALAVLHLLDTGARAGDKAGPMIEGETA